MSKSETIAKLEALLARVRSHADQPRRRPVAVAAAHVQAPPAPPVEFDEVDAVTIPPPPMAPARAPVTTEADVVMEVDVVQEAVGDTVIGVTTEEIVISEALGSRERLVAAAPVPLEAVSAVVGEAPPPELMDESPPEVLAAVEEVEEAPLSSRRPVAPQPEERLADMAFGTVEPRPPRHTPPPESGRLPAAPAVEFDADVTGVREATPIAPRSRELVPEATRAHLAPSDAVADIVAEAQRFAPTTFAELLDASLAL